ncbi:MAG: TonB C-terminal domain-containing protein [Myxococcota bacterium]
MMYVDAEDIRPPSALRAFRPDVPQLVGGLLTALLAPSVLFLSAVVFGSAAAALFGERDEEKPVEERVISAEFVRLGEPLDPNQLPNRDVPLQATAPDDEVAVSDDPQEPTEPPPDAGPPPPDHAEVDDLMQNLSEKAHKFAEIDKQRELEGSPDGLAEGTADEASEGSMLGIFFRKGWNVPNTIPDGELPGLVADARVRFGEDLTIRSFELEEKSGNPEFDQSVVDQLQRLQDDGARIPDAPDDPADRYRGATVIGRFNGKDAR